MFANFSFPIGISILLWLMNLAHACICITRVKINTNSEKERERERERERETIILSLKDAWIPKSNDPSMYAIVMNTFREYASLGVGFLLNKAFSYK